MHSGCLVGMFANSLEQRDHAEELAAIKMGPICTEEHFWSFIGVTRIVAKLGNAKVHEDHNSSLWSYLMHAISVRLPCENMVTSLSHVFLCFPGSITDCCFLMINIALCLLLLFL